jgi:hypothetical protein
MVLGSLSGANDGVSSAPSETRPTVTSLWIRNRGKSSDAFGLLSINGVVLDARGSDLAIEVGFGGYFRRLSAAEALCTPSPDGSIIAEFHLLTHLVPNGAQVVNAALIAGEERIEFPPLQLDINNDSNLARQVAKDLQESGAEAIEGRIIDSTMFPYDNGTARAWFNADFDDDIPMSLEPAANAEMAQRHLLRWGFCVLHEQLPRRIVEDFKQELSAAIDRCDLAYKAGSSDRIHGAHEKLPAARAVWLYPPVLQFLEDYFKDTPCACQTLTYVNGSEQNAHQDSIHLTPYPNGFMCGVWVALEDVQENSGELFVYPGSHRSGSVRATPLGLGKVINNDYSQFVVFDRAIKDIIESEGYERLVYRPKAGQILVWHENTIHGGSPRLDHSRTRLSVVSHYFAKGAIGYYDSRGEAASLETLDKQ